MSDDNLLYKPAEVCLHCSSKMSFKHTELFVACFFPQDDKKKTCKRCGNNLHQLNITICEVTAIIKEIAKNNPCDSTVVDKVLEWNELKNNNLEEYNQKIEPLLKEYMYNFVIPTTTTTQQNIPKCPTCGSTNVKKISGGKRWFGVGLFGLASSNVGKTYECKNCQYKW